MRNDAASREMEKEEHPKEAEGKQRTRKKERMRGR